MEEPHNRVETVLFLCWLGANVDREAYSNPEVFQHVDEDDAEEDAPVENLKPDLRLLAFVLPFVAKQNLRLQICEACRDHDE